ncbi:hypothetical protein MMC17_009447 [Xylographa soralifera]|nr:hypothetical protein [Xylographa soralifera]
MLLLKESGPGDLLGLGDSVSHIWEQKLSSDDVSALIRFRKKHYSGTDEHFRNLNLLGARTIVSGLVAYGWTYGELFRCQTELMTVLSKYINRKRLASGEVLGLEQQDVNQNPISRTERGTQLSQHVVALSTGTTGQRNAKAYPQDPKRISCDKEIHVMPKDHDDQHQTTDVMEKGQTRDMCQTGVSGEIVTPAVVSENESFNYSDSSSVQSTVQSSCGGYPTDTSNEASEVQTARNRLTIDALLMAAHQSDFSTFDNLDVQQSTGDTSHDSNNTVAQRTNGLDITGVATGHLGSQTSLLPSHLQEGYQWSQTKARSTKMSWNSIRNLDQTGRSEEYVHDNDYSTEIGAISSARSQNEFSSTPRFSDASELAAQSSYQSKVQTHIEASRNHSKPDAFRKI